MIRFVLSLLLCSALLLGLSHFLQRGGYLDIFPTFLIETCVFLFLSTVLIFYYLIRRGHGAFVQLYLLTMVIKLLAYGGYNIFMILEDRPNAGLNVGFFMITYILFTTIELVFLYRRISS